MPDTDALPEVLTAEQVARVLKVTTSSVYRWAVDGTLPSLRLGGTVRFRRSHIERLLGEAS